LFDDVGTLQAMEIARIAGLTPNFNDGTYLAALLRHLSNSNPFHYSSIYSSDEKRNNVFQ